MLMSDCRLLRKESDYKAGINVNLNVRVLAVGDFIVEDS